MTHMPTGSTDRTVSRRLMELRSHGGHAFYLAILLPLGAGLLLVGQALLLANVLGQAIEEGVSLATLMPLLVGICVILIARIALILAGEQAGQIAAERIKLTLRNQLFSHILERRRALDLAPTSGALSASIVDQTEALEAFFARYLPAMIGAVFLPIAFAVILFPVDWIVALLFLLTAPAIPLFMALAGMGAQAATDRQANALTRLSAYFADRLRGLVTLKLLGQEKAQTAAVHAASENLRRRTNRVLAIAFLSSAILEFFAALGVAGVALYVGLTYLGFLPFHPELTLTMGFFALLMAPEVYHPLRQLAAHYHDRAAARSALVQIENQIAQIDKLESCVATEPTRVLQHPVGLAIEGLEVRTPAGRSILDRFDLFVPAGEHLAIMGESGVGKTTLMRAIARLIPFAGDIRFDGTPSAELTEADLRKQLSVISQKSHIFHGTIADNIGFANPHAERHEIEAAARRACVLEFSDSLPDGLDTLVGDNGTGLSGGQIQRVALARLFLTDPGLVILDEPTAHLDGNTEADVLDELFAFAQARTLIVLTHSVAVAERADRIMRLAAGKLLDTPHRRVSTAIPKEHRA